MSWTCTRWRCSGRWSSEKSFSRAARRLGRTQPAISLAVQRLEAELGERLIDRLGKDLRLTDAGTLVLDFARRFENLRQELVTAIAERRDNAAGRLTIGANESTTLYLLPHLARYRRRYPRVRVQVRRSLSSRIPSELIDGDLELGVISYEPQDDRLATRVIYSDHLAFVVSPQHRLARRKSCPSPSWAWRCSSPTTWSRPTGTWSSASSSGCACR